MHPKRTIIPVLFLGLAIHAGIGLAAPSQARLGLVSVEGHALRDEQGPFLGLGVTYMPALWRAKHDPKRFRGDLAFLSDKGFNYIRVLSMVGWNEAWHDREIAPVSFTNRTGQAIAAWPDYWEQLRQMIDVAYDEYGLRTQITVFADAQLMPSKQARLAHLEKLLEVIHGREQKIILIEIANEAWQNGFPGPEGIAELQDLGRYVAEKTCVPVALSSPESGDERGIRQLYAQSAADIATIHLTRDKSTIEGGWLPVRDAFRMEAIADIPPVSSNEPIGPGSSVNSETDPMKLVTAAIYAWMSGLPMYVFHTDAGVFGKTRFEDAPGIQNFAHLAKLLPPDVANWQRMDLREATAPFSIFADDQPGQYWPAKPHAVRGAVRGIACIRKSDFVVLLIGVLKDGADLQAEADMSIEVFDPLTGGLLEKATVERGGKYGVPANLEAFLIKGQFRGKD